MFKYISFILITTVTFSFTNVIGQNSSSSANKGSKSSGSSNRFLGNSRVNSIVKNNSKKNQFNFRSNRSNKGNYNIKTGSFNIDNIVKTNSLDGSVNTNKKIDKYKAFREYASNYIKKQKENKILSKLNNKNTDKKTKVLNKGDKNTTKEENVEEAEKEEEVKTIMTKHGVIKRLDEVSLDELLLSDEEVRGVDNTVVDFDEKNIKSEKTTTKSKEIKFSN